MFFYIFITENPLYSQSCCIKINELNFVFPMKVEFAVNQLGFHYDYDFKYFHGPHQDKDSSNWISITSLLLKDKNESFTIVDWFKQEKDFFDEDVLGVKGIANGTLTEVRKKLENLYKIKFGEEKFSEAKNEIFKEGVVYHQAKYADCLLILIYKGKEKDLNYPFSYFLIIYGIQGQKLRNYF